jgi:hypothetical protein
MKPQTLLIAAAVLVLWLASTRRATAGLPVPPAAAFPKQADSPFGESETGGGFPQVLY